MTNADKRVAYELRMMADTFRENADDLDEWNHSEGDEFIAMGFRLAARELHDRADYLDPEGREPRESF